MRSDQRLQLRPRHNPIHLFQKLLPPRLLAVLLEAPLRSQSKLPHPRPASLFNINRLQCRLGSSSEVPLISLNKPCAGLIISEGLSSLFGVGCNSGRTVSPG